LAQSRAAVVRALRRAKGGNQRLLGVKGTNLDRARHANRSLVGAPTMPAWRRYTGVVWDHLVPAELTTAQRRSIIVVSGLHGLIRGDDPTPDYRLKIGANLAPLGLLSTWWRTTLSDTLGTHATRPKRFVVDLLPLEHRAAWVPRGVDGVSVVLRERSGRPGGHFAKAAKGELARHLLTSTDPPLAALSAWDHPTYALEIAPL
jgi:cytoplasmic iron level regulating protein YaaA (DUF328/UPF0246 family)